MTASATYDTVADFIASMGPAKILELHAPETMQQRLEELLEKENQG